MVDTKTINRAASRREKREEHEKQKAIHRTNVDAKATSDALRKVTPAQKEEHAARKAAAPKVSRKEQRIAAQRRAEDQAAKDALLRPPAFVPEEHVVAPGETPPLHVLNKQSQLATMAIREEAVEMGKKVGGMVRDLAMGSRLTRIGNRGNRFERMAIANAQMTAAAEANKQKSNA